MTLDEAVTQSLKEIAGVFEAIRVANGNPIVMPDGSRAMAVKPPDLGGVVLKILSTQSILLQCVRAQAGMLQGGFRLSDEEANRVADLVIERIKAVK
jgi:hypothetical protein